MKRYELTSSKDGGIGRYTLPPPTTKRRSTANLKTKNNQNCQKIELYGSPTTKELKRKYLFRLVGGTEMGSWSGEDAQKGYSWRTGWVRQCLVDLKAMQSEITKIIKFLNGFMKKKKRKIYREPTKKGRKLGLRSKVWSRRRKETFNQNRLKKQEFKKNEEWLRNFWDNFKYPNI